MCALLVGLPGVTIRGVGEWPTWLRVEIETQAPRPDCAGCGAAAWDHGQREVALVDLPLFGRPARLVWRKQRWRCPNRSCAVVTWSEHDPSIASEQSALTTRHPVVGSVARLGGGVWL
jgi:transposase